jgi:hypothetical protein
MTTIVSAEQFQARGRLTVVHLPTGWRFSTYAYEKPQDVQIAVRIISDATPPGVEGFDVKEVEDIALRLLRELTAR